MTLFNKLQNSMGIENEFENILAKCEKGKAKFCDSDFYPSTLPTDADNELLQGTEWKYVKDVYSNKNLFDNVSPNHIGQGNLNDCYLITALIYISHYPNLVKSIFHPKSNLEHGIALVYFKIMGENLPIIIDTRLPFKADISKSKNKNPQPLFAYSRVDGCSPAWFALIEKAYAKACGGFKAIEYGQAHIAIHNLLGWFGTTIKDITENGEKEKIFYDLMELNNKNAMLSCSIEFDRLCSEFSSFEALEKKIGLVASHSYQILDVKEACQIMFVKLRNPWCKFEWKGDYSRSSNKWTPKLKQQLDYSNGNDEGSFWMQFDDFYKYFTDISYSVPPQKDYISKSFCGVIDGYLDNRSACSGCKNAGCLPQWSLRFTKTGLIRIHAEITGPHVFHGINIVYNKGKKVQTIIDNTENLREGNDSQINGVQYEITDIEYPWTVFLDRSNGCPDKPSKPSFYRITVEANSDFTLKKIENDFANMHSVSASGIFLPGDEDGWNPYGNKAITTCRQWSFRFTRPTTLFVRIFKSLSQGRHDIMFGYTNEKISMAYKSTRAQHYFLNATSDYEEVSFDVDLIEKNYSLCIYREKSDDISKFKFIAYSDDDFEFSELPDIECSPNKEEADFPEIDPIKQPENFKPTHSCVVNRDFQIPRSKCCFLL